MGACGWDRAGAHGPMRVRVHWNKEGEEQKTGDDVLRELQQQGQQPSTGTSVRSALLGVYNPHASTGMRLRDNDKYQTNLTRTLFPSPAAGSGNKLFLLVHVLVHVTSLVLSAAFLGTVGEKASDNQIRARTPVATAIPSLSPLRVWWRRRRLLCGPPQPALPAGRGRGHPGPEPLEHAPVRLAPHRARVHALVLRGVAGLPHLVLLGDGGHPGRRSRCARLRCVTCHARAYAPLPTPLLLPRSPSQASSSASFRRGASPSCSRAS